MDMNNMELNNPVVDANNSQIISKGNNQEALSEFKEKEEIIGDHDIVIDDDFQFKLDVATVQGNIDYTSAQKDNTNTESEIGAEQTGNITF